MEKEKNPNNIKVGDTIEVEQAWEDETGNYHDEVAVVDSIDKDGFMKLIFSRDDITDFLADADFEAKDYKPLKD